MARPKREPMKRRCKFVTTRAKKRCTYDAKPGGYYCAFHAQQFQSKDPVKRAAQRAGLKQNSGTNQHRQKQFGIEPVALAERVAAILEGVPARDKDGNVPKSLHRTAGYM